MNYKKYVMTLGPRCHIETLLAEKGKHFLRNNIVKTLNKSCLQHLVILKLLFQSLAINRVSYVYVVSYILIYEELSQGFIINYIMPIISITRDNPSSNELHKRNII